MDQIAEVAFLCIVIGSVTYSSYQLCVYLSTVLDRENEFPPDALSYHHPFTEPLDSACQVTAQGVFSLLTGISCTKLAALGYASTRQEFDQSDSGKQVMYMSFTWKDWSLSMRGKENTLFHALVYYDGYLYQSYRTRRHWWSHAMDSYPFIRQKLTQEDRELFEKDTRLFNARCFNRLCAPLCHPIPEDATLRCIELYIARVDPTRSEIKLTCNL